MSARDELFQLICGRTTTKAVERILAAGYRKPQTIQYVDEMEELPAGTVILDAGGDICKHRGDGYWDSMAEPEEAFHYGDFDSALPATVLHVGGAE